MSNKYIDDFINDIDKIDAHVLESDIDERRLITKSDNSAKINDSDDTDRFILGLIDDLMTLRKDDKIITGFYMEVTFKDNPNVMTIKYIPDGVPIPDQE